MFSRFILVSMKFVVPLTMPRILADVVGGQALVHQGDDGRAAADTGLKQEGRVVRFGKGQQFRAVGSDHFLIRSADAAALSKHWRTYG